MNQDEIQNLINSTLDTRETQNQYGVTKVPFHTHNGVDSPPISNNNSTILNGRAGGTTVTTIHHNADTKLPLKTKTFVNGITFDSVNGKFILTPGYYQINAQVTYSSVTAQFYTEIWINGAYSTYAISQGSATQSLCVSDIFKLNANDYVELYTRQNTAGDETVQDDIALTFLSIAKF